MQMPARAISLSLLLALTPVVLPLLGVTRGVETPAGGHDLVMANNGLKHSQAGKPDLVDSQVPMQDKSLDLSSNGKPILTYQAACVPSPVADAPWYGRSGFIHPVYSPRGNVVTEAFPDDYPHQHALMFAWTSATYQGQQVDFWNSHKKQGKVEHVKTLKVDKNTIKTQLRHLITTGEHKGITVLDETWTITKVPHDSLNVFDLVSVQTCATDKPLIIRKYKYGGMCIRGPASWSNGDAMLTSDGNSQADGNHTRPNWVALFGQANRQGKATGQWCGIAAMAHPDNHYGPQPVRLHEKQSYFCFAPMVLGDIQIKPGQPFTSSFRFVAYDGKPSPESLDAVWDDFSED